METLRKRHSIYTYSGPCCLGLRSWIPAGAKHFAVIKNQTHSKSLLIPLYLFSLFKGVIDCTKEPEALQNQILTSVLISTGCRDPKDINIVHESDIKWHSRARHQQVAAVGHKIVTTAREYVQRELQEAMEAVKRKLPDDIAPEAELLAMEMSEQVKFWYNARLRLEGESVIKQPWQYVFIQSEAPNAFVTEILPRRFFITTSMLNIAETPDELALVLGHEVSHLILGHVSDTNRVETALRTVEVLLLSIDPTAGLLSVGVMGLIYAARKVVSAAYSRNNETQADELGIKLAAAACYDTKLGSRVMYKMHQASLGMSSSSKEVIPNSPSLGSGRDVFLSPSVVRLMDTHPPTLDRWESLQRAAEEGENYTKHNHCKGIHTRLFNALWSSITDNSKDSNTENKNKK